MEEDFDTKSKSNGIRFHNRPNSYYSGDMKTRLHLEELNESLKQSPNIILIENANNSKTHSIKKPNNMSDFLFYQICLFREGKKNLIMVKPNYYLFRSIDNNQWVVFKKNFIQIEDVDFDMILDNEIDLFFSSLLD